jgi:integrase
MSAPLVKTRTPGIYKRGRKWVATWRDPHGQPRKRSAATEREAKAIKAAMEADIRRGEYREQERVTFVDYADRWIATFRGRTSRGIRPETLDDYRRDLGPLTKEEWDAWQAEQRRFEERIRERVAMVARERTGRNDPASVEQLEGQTEKLRAELERVRNRGGAAAFFRAMQLSAIAPQTIKEYAAKLAARGLSPGSIRNALAPVKAMLADAFEEGVIRSNPAAGVRIFTPADDGDEPEEEQAKALTEDELRALLEATPDEWRLFVEFLAHTGLRIGEAAALRRCDVDFGRRRVMVRRRLYRGRFGPPKSKYGRRDVPLSTSLAQTLWRARGTASSEAPLFASRTGGHLDASNVAARVFKPAAAEAGVPWAHFHTLRHTCATMLFRNGLNAKQVQVWLGHHSPAFTLATYVHLLDDDLPDPAFLDGLTAGVATEVATRPAQMGLEMAPVELPESRLVPEEPRPAETASGSS